MELFDALRAYLCSDPVRLHTPGHKGVLPYPLAEAARWDLTELPGTDSLYEADGCLRALEDRFAALYGAGRSLLSAGGATLCVQTMLALCGNGPVVCGRDIHTSALNAMGLLGISPVWIPCAREAHGIPLPPSPDEARTALRRQRESGRAASALYVTSPNYYGVLADINGLAAAAHESGALLLVDNAHGAHLPFLPGGLHPLRRGADICCDSLHKTLPALTGAALLHLRPGFPDMERAKVCMSWFGSSSPSYLILLSCDLLLSALENGLPAALEEAAAHAAALRKRLGDWALPGGDPMRLTLPLAGSALRSDTLYALLTESGLEPEMCNALGAVLLCAPQTDFSCLASFADRLCALPLSSPPALPPLPLPRAVAAVREAMLAPSETVPLLDAEGRTAASVIARCPPGVPLVMPGELLDKPTIFFLKSTGISVINVVK